MKELVSVCSCVVCTDYRCVQRCGVCSEDGVQTQSSVQQNGNDYSYFDIYAQDTPGVLQEVTLVRVMVDSNVTSRCLRHTPTQMFEDYFHGLKGR